tara:strand:- start:216 stop:1097 length:882 start_codon:yes stop_codon:yes gene_type:complete
MEKIKIYFLKSLKKLKLWEYFNFVFSKKINSVEVKIPIRGNVGLTNMQLQQNWLDLLIKIFSLKDNLSTFVDVGVNIGQTLLRLKTIYPEIDYLGFEPNSTCTAYVQKLIAINKFKNCTVQNVALSTEIGTLQLEKDSDTDSRASLIHNLRPDFFSTKESVFALDYQSIYLDKTVSFIKIDVEFAEYEVLKGMEKAIEKHQPIITCEVLDSHNLEVLDLTQKRATKLCEMLKSWNYSIIRLQTEASNIVNYEKIEMIKIIQWSSESFAYNDYLFYPTNEEKSVIEKLRMIVKN